TDALNAALAIRQVLQEFNQSHADYGLPGPIEVGTGIHSGQAVIGTLGAQQRMDTTVIGDVVNTAARLEELTKTYHHPIICSESVVQSLPPDH
ncbi:adenylate/guanylate cyclase domain-containing protein, partial [Haemophilus parainfluenzae]|uniref:adenylate/guanylate cyclase domain-containing protein n=1 Tax=Haemophilus parainfluenzae TaxID=729 RepID=UPI00124B6E17